MAERMEEKERMGREGKRQGKLTEMIVEEVSARLGRGCKEGVVPWGVD